ncbi:hypothetical protein DK254_00050 [Pseudomonas sp. RW407]|uniref:hypothetical protein n=1 Tax=Pseudomonas sp. RW407 TaxID=2202894 RepID=UPI000D6EC47A|nr:hypothetical protein [Pseudomonas sp. RW407]PWU30682.1 hypothetical protein DK254_11470 [Pseudomonas sp. RW407]PWU32115.1 hypothetical protein DK254_00050 [Pseudomonas sp. RW407]
MNPYHITGPAQIGFSGGRSSGFMLYHILEGHGGQLPSDVHVTFQNTGKERPETLDFIRECQLHWGVPITWLEFDGVYGQGLSWKEVTYESASRNGEPFDLMLRYYADYRREEKEEPPILPNPANRMCTDRMKIKAATWWMRDVLGHSSWDAIIGIRADEPKRYHRMMAANEKGSNRWENVTPMYHAGVLKADVNSFWARQLFDLGIDSDLGNCDLCFLKKPEKIIRAIVENPQCAKWWIEAEDRSGQVFRQDRPNYRALAWMADQLRRQIPLDLDFSETEDLIDCMCGD